MGWHTLKHCGWVWLVSVKIGQVLNTSSTSTKTYCLHATSVHLPLSICQHVPTPLHVAKCSITKASNNFWTGLCLPSSDCNFNDLRTFESASCQHLVWFVKKTSAESSQHCKLRLTTKFSNKQTKMSSSPSYKFNNWIQPSSQSFRHSSMIWLHQFETLSSHTIETRWRTTVVGVAIKSLCFGSSLVHQGYHRIG